VLKYLTWYILKQWSLVELFIYLYIITTLIIVMMMMAYDSNNINCQLIPESYMWIIHCTVQWWRLIRSCLIFPPQEDNIYHYQYLRAFPDKCKAESNLGMAVQVFLFLFYFFIILTKEVPPPNQGKIYLYRLFESLATIKPSPSSEKSKENQNQKSCFHTIYFFATSTPVLVLSLSLSQ